MARKGYPAEFRRRALDLVAAGKTVAEGDGDASMSVKLSWVSPRAFGRGGGRGSV